MQVKVYLPQTVEIPSEYLPVLARRAFDRLDAAGEGTTATRGHLVRQAVRDGLLRELDDLMQEDGSVDLFCDPRDEIPLEVENRVLNMSELIDALHRQHSPKTQVDVESERPTHRIVPKRKAA